MDNKYRIAAACYGVLLTVFTGYVLMNTFVLSAPIQTEANKMNLALFDEDSAAPVTAAPSSGKASAATSVTAQETTAASAVHSAVTNQTTAATASDDSAATEKIAADTQGNKDTVTAAKDAPAQQTETVTEAAAEITTVPMTEPPAPETAPPVEFISNENVYQDENIRIDLCEYSTEDTAVYVAEVTLRSAQYLKTAFADDTYGRNITAHTSDIAAAHNAILAVNGDFYGARESGYVIRNGVLYRDAGSANDVLCILSDGSFFIANSAEYSAQDLLDMGAWQALSFGPALVQGGGITVGAQDEVDIAMASNPRTALGIIDELHYVFVVSDGRTHASKGLSLYELAVFMQGLGVQTAYNLDGGGSSTLYFNGAVINQPTTSGRSIKERSVSDIVYIGY